MAKGAHVNRALERLRQFDRGNTVQPGVFSTLDEAIKDAPFDTNSIDQWRNYLKPGRVVKRQGAQFPLKKEELEWSLNRLDIDPDRKLTRDELRELIAQNRQGFGVTMAQELPEEPLTSPMRIPIPDSWGSLGSSRNIRVEHPRYGSEYAGDTDSRLFHASPGSTYEESVTRMPGLEFPNHFDPDTVSWSRTSSHNTLPLSRTSRGEMEPLAANKRVRLVEEIQSDLHSAAAELRFFDPVTGKHYNRIMATTSPVLEDSVKKRLIPSRAGHRTPEVGAELSRVKRELDEVILRNLHRDSPEGRLPDPEQDELIARLTSLEKSFETIPPDAPYKNPRDYAGLELRKQLLNAVDNDEDYLALVRGSDQIERYSQGMNDRGRAGMEKMYDEVYPSELKKLAKRYGATVEDVEVSVTSGSDIRPPTMSELGMENVDDLGIMVHESMEGAESASEVLMDLESYTDDFNFVRHEMSGLGWNDDFEELQRRLNAISKSVERTFTGALEDNQEMLKEYQSGVIGEFQDAHKEFKSLYQEYELSFNAEKTRSKTFPAMKLTPEVKERILELGVPQFARGGVVKMREGGLSVFGSMFRRPDAQTTEDQYQEVLSALSESEDERVLQEKMGGLDYYTDALKFIPAIFAARFKKVDPETGEVRWLGRAPMPDIEDVGRGFMTMEEWEAERDAAIEYNESGEDFRSTWIDDTKAMAMLPAMIGNLAGEYTPLPGSLTDPDEAFGYPEFAMEAGERVGLAERDAQEAFGLDDPTGPLQHITASLGAMGAQVPVPGNQLRGMARGATDMIPGAVKKAVKPLGVMSEFVNPFIDPTVKNYRNAALFGGAIGTTFEPDGEDIREFKEMQVRQQEQQEFEEMSPMLTEFVESSWDGLSEEERAELAADPEYGGVVLNALTDEQYEEFRSWIGGGG